MQKHKTILKVPHLLFAISRKTQRSGTFKIFWGAIVRVPVIVTNSENRDPKFSEFNCLEIGRKMIRARANSKCVPLILRSSNFQIFRN